MDLGDKIPRREICEKYVPEGDRSYQGELTLMTSCAWRIEREGTGIVSGSGDCDDETMLSGLTNLVGQTVAEISVDSFLDLLVVFSGGLRLRLFCDQSTEDLNNDCCYTLFIRGEGAWSVTNNVITHEGE